LGEEGFHQYVDDLLGAEDPLLTTLRREASDAGLPAIQIPMELVRLLRVLIAQGTIERVLEIGTLFGYSSIVMARALPEAGRLVTLEVDKRHAELARHNLQRAGVVHKVEVRLGPALETLAGLAGSTFDLVFIDADKESYPEYLEWALKLTEPGSLIVADNVWRNGSVTNPDSADAMASAVARFNANLASNPRLETVLLPTRNGADAASLSVVRKV